MKARIQCNRGVRLAQVVAVALLVLAGSSSAQTQNTVTSFTYDANGNLKTQAKPGSAQRSYVYDALNRVVQSNVVPTTGTTYFTKLTLDGIDQLTGVTDPRNLSTTYTVDGFGGRTALASPDTGSASSAFDENGNLLSSTDARGKTTTYTYDALNRVTSVTYGASTPVVYEYDGGPNGPASSIGKISRVTNAVDDTAYTYDELGRIASKADTISVPGAAQLVRRVAYTYVQDGAGKGHVASMTYPSGNRINYSYDSAGRVAALTLNPADGVGGTAEGTVVPLLSGITYTPTGNPQSWKWGVASAGNLYTRTYDLDDRLVTYPLGSASGLVRTLTYDAGSRITNYTHAGPTGASGLDQTFGYDVYDRLTSSTAGGATTTYTYDANGNRTASTGPAASFTIDGASNRLSSATQPARSYGYDAMGNVTSAGSWQYSYGDDGRLEQAASPASVVSYWYDGKGQRVAKLGAALRYYAYDEAGQTIGEYSGTSPVEETVYLGSIPVVVLAPGVNYVFADHLNAPRVLEDENGNVTWSWLDTNPFGAGGATASAAVAEYNHRFPGQIYDVETGLHYNYFRDYDPQTGRYIESDPIGLAGGINTFGYVGGNPIANTDPMGLATSIRICLNGICPPGPAPGIIDPVTREPWASVVDDGDGRGRESRSRESNSPKNCPDDNQRCQMAEKDARSAHWNLTMKRIPHYLSGGTNGSDAGHYEGILQKQKALRDAIRRVKLYCKPLPLELPEWEQTANQSIPQLHK